MDPQPSTQSDVDRNASVAKPEPRQDDGGGAVQTSEASAKSEDLVRQTTNTPQERRGPRVPSTAFKDNPALLAMMRTQQAAMLDMLFRDFFSKAALSPSQRDEMTKLLVDSQMELMDKTAALAGDREAIAKVGASQQAALGAQIKALLGNDKYQEYESYRTTVPERLQLNTLSLQMTTAGVPFSDTERTTLLNIMLDEKARVPPPQRSADKTEAEYLRERLAWADVFDKNVGTRADQALTSDQLRVFRQYQEQQAALRKNSANLLSAPQPGGP